MKFNFQTLDRTQRSCRYNICEYVCVCPCALANIGHCVVAFIAFFILFPFPFHFLFLFIFFFFCIPSSALKLNVLFPISPERMARTRDYATLLAFHFNFTWKFTSQPDPREPLAEIREIRKAWPKCNYMGFSKRVKGDGEWGMGGGEYTIPGRGRQPLL